MMAGLLTQEEANELIEMLKKTVEQQIAFPSEKGGISFDVIGNRREDIFIINIDRKGKLAENALIKGECGKVIRFCSGLT